jgi:hypothetical protein
MTDSAGERQLEVHRIVEDVRPLDAGQERQAIQAHAALLQNGFGGHGYGGVESQAPGVVGGGDGLLGFEQVVAGELVAYLRTQGLATEIAIVPQFHPLVPDLLEVGLVGWRAIGGFEFELATDRSDQLLESLESTGHCRHQAANIGGITALKRQRFGV